MNIFQWLGDHRNIIPFFLIGLVSTFADVSLLYTLTSWLGLWYIVSTSISYGFGIIVSYSLNRYFTFHDGNRHIIVQFTTFAGISLICLLLNITILWLIVEMVKVNYLVAKLPATAGVFLINYYGQSRITFRTKKVAPRDS